jgi:predicted transglutaminase-like cysteine proteinase
MMAAATEDTQVSGAWVTGFVVAVIGAISTAVAHRTGKASRVTFDQQPLGVKLEDHFITRREFDQFKGELRNDITEIKGLFAQTMQEIKAVNSTLTKDIRDMGTAAYNGRQKLWDQVNEQRERLGVVEAIQRVPALHPKTTPRSNGH